MNYYVIAKHDVMSPCPVCRGKREEKKLCTACGGIGKKITTKISEIPLNIAIKAITTQTEENVEKKIIKQNVDFLIDLCCEHFKTTRKEMFKRHPQREHSDIRYMIFYYCMKSLKLTEKTTGKLVGGFGRGVVNWGTKKVQEWIHIDPEYNRKFNEFLNIINTNKL